MKWDWFSFLIGLVSGLLICFGIDKAFKRIGL